MPRLPLPLRRHVEAWALPGLSAREREVLLDLRAEVMLRFSWMICFKVRFGSNVTVTVDSRTPWRYRLNAEPLYDGRRLRVVRNWSGGSRICLTREECAALRRVGELYLEEGRAGRAESWAAARRALQVEEPVRHVDPVGLRHRGERGLGEAPHEGAEVLEELAGRDLGAAG